VWDTCPNGSVQAEARKKDDFVSPDPLIVVVREGLEPATSPDGISKLLNYIAHLSLKSPPDPRIWHWSRDAVVAQRKRSKY
jgi:hypothetical protein